MGEERRGMKRGKEDEGREREGLPPLEWRSGYAPGPSKETAAFTPEPMNDVLQMKQRLIAVWSGLQQTVVA